MIEMKTYTVCIINTSHKIPAFPLMEV